MRRIILIITLPLVAIGGFILYTKTIRPDIIAEQIMNSDNYQGNLKRFAEIPVKSDEIILIGNSIMVDFQHELIQHPRITKMAINGDLLEGLEARESILADRQLSHVVVALGINDILNGDDFKIRHIEEFLSFIRNAHPRTELTIMSITPTGLNPGVFTRPHVINHDIEKANQAIREFCDLESLVFIDTWSGLCEESRLKSEYTYDGVHLTEQGYAVWGEPLVQYLTEVLKARNPAE